MCKKNKFIGGINIINFNIIQELKNLPHDFPNKENLIKKTKFEDKFSKNKIEEIRLKHKIDSYQLIGSIVVNHKKLNSMGFYEYFKDSNNYYDINNDDEYNKFIDILISLTKEESKPTIKKEEVISKTIEEIVAKYQLADFKEKLENFNSLPSLEQGEILHKIKNLTKHHFVSFYKDLRIDKSKVSIRIKLFDLSLEFPEFNDIIQVLKIGIIGCFPQNNYSLKKDILEKIHSGELKQDRNEISSYINQKKFSDNEKDLDNMLINLKSYLNKKKYAKLSDKDQQRVLNHFKKIEDIIEKKGL